MIKVLFSCVAFVFVQCTELVGGNIVSWNLILVDCQALSPTKCLKCLTSIKLACLVPKLW